MTQIVPFCHKALLMCSEHLKSGKLVAFPTETVYGLGANIFNEAAVKSIYEVKGRPQTDPLIVHISKLDQIWDLVDLNDFQKKALSVLSKEFWPGPLTLILTRSQKVSKLVTAGGESVGIRIPNHPVALGLLEICSLPIAAPSANKFGHVSPTTAEHVKNDFPNVDDLLVLDTTEFENRIGVESTVIKIGAHNTIEFLRPGAVGSSEIISTLEKNQISFEIVYISKFVEKLTQGQDSPGQLLTHYAPFKDTFILNKDTNNKVFYKNDLKDCAIIDFERKYIQYSKNSLYYFDLSTSGDALEASKNIFSALREAEKLDQVKFILIAEIKGNDGLLKALNDRITRAASAKQCSLFNE